MFENFGINITNLFKSAEHERIELHHPYVGTEHLLLAILKDNNEYKNILSNYGLNYDNFRRELIAVVGVSSKETTINLYTPLLKRVINNAIESSKEDNNGKVTIRHLIISMLEEGEGIAIRLLIGMNIDIDNIYDSLNSNVRGDNKKLTIFEIGSLLNEKVDSSEIVVGRDKEISLLIETLLRKKKNNPLLIGEAGVGKTAIVEELVRRINRKEVPDYLFNKKIVMLEMSSLVSGTKYRGEFEEKLTKILKEVEENNDIILFIDEIHTMVNAGGAEGAITAGDILKPALARGNIKCIGATTIYEYNKYFEQDKALQRRFETILVNEPNNEETKNILYKIKKEYETHHNVIVQDDVINEIINLTSKFISNKKNPDKSIDFLDSACAYVKLKNNYVNDLKILYDELDRISIKKRESVKNNNYDLALNLYNDEISLNNKISNLKLDNIVNVTKEDIIQVLENKTNIPLTKLKLNFLLKLKNELKNKYYNIDNEIDTLIDTIYNNLLNKNSFIKCLIKGSVGLGKTSIVRNIANSFKRANIINLDMKEYTNSMSLSKLLGVSSGYVGYNDDYVFKKIKNNSFNILVIDNYEEAATEVKNIFNEILENGVVQDNKGETINFNNTIIFVLENTIKENIVGFSNNKIKNFDIENNYTITINFDNINEEVLINYLKALKIKDNIIKKIIEESNYLNNNYKNIKKLIDNNYVNN